jgi:hypothetical protein
MMSVVGGTRIELALDLRLTIFFIFFSSVGLR